MIHMVRTEFLDRKLFLFIAIVGVFLNAGCGAEASNTIRETNVKNGDTTKEAVELPDAYLGRWGGTGGGLFDITKSEVINVLTEKKFKYHLVEIREKDGRKEYLLELTDPDEGYIKRFMLLKFVKEDHLYYFGFDTYDASLKSNYSGAGEFFKNTPTE